MKHYRMLRGRDIDLVKRMSEHFTPAEIADDLGCCPCTVKRVQALYGLPRYSLKRRWTDEEERQLVDLYVAKIPVPDIAEKLQRTCSGVVVRIEALRKKGIVIDVKRDTPGRPRKKVV